MYEGKRSLLLELVLEHVFDAQMLKEEGNKLLQIKRRTHGFGDFLSDFLALILPYMI
jgi:hypothetical protein